MNRKIGFLYVKTSDVNVGECRYRSLAIGTAERSAIAFTLITPRTDDEARRQLKKVMDARKLYLARK